MDVLFACAMSPLSPQAISPDSLLAIASARAAPTFSAPLGPQLDRCRLCFLVGALRPWDVRRAGIAPTSPLDPA